MIGDYKLRIVHLCHTLGTLYLAGGLADQPAWFISTMEAYIVGKNQAENSKNTSSPMI